MWRANIATRAGGVAPEPASSGARFASHLSFEDAQLAPILRAIPGNGDALADRLAREHREQRELLHYLVGRLRQESRPTTLITRELTSLCEYLRQDMGHEEVNLVLA
jgi:hypothetical protein